MSDKLAASEDDIFQLLSSYLQVHAFISTTEASKLFRKTNTTMRRYMAKFTDVGLLEASGENKNRKYALK